MKKILLISLLLFSYLSPIKAQTSKDADRQELQDLLDDRKKKFDAYSASIEKHSGIFGNKTRGDIKKSNEVLIDIAKTDNRIISTLYRVVDFRTYEKVNMNYDLQKRDALLDNLRHAADTLSKQVEALKISNHALQSRSTRFKWLLYALLSLVIWLVIALRRKRTKKAQS